MEDFARVDGVRASRDGHQFHEAWAARAVLALLPPDSPLSAVAIEGLSIEESHEFSAEAHDIADIVRYFGGRSTASADRTETVQFKYSIASAPTPMRAAEMAKTIAKFAAIERDLVAAEGSGPERSHYELVTNRAIDPDTLLALTALQNGSEASGRAERHRQALAGAAALSGNALRAFASRLVLTGTREDLGRIEHQNLHTLASWSGATDSLSLARLANIRKLVRDRAGGRGQNDNLLLRVDMLGALDIAHERELYPVAPAFPPVDNLIERPVLDDLSRLLFADPRALLVHAAGGIGKTVLMQALAHRLDPDHHVLLFDGFGAGLWREPADGRHLPRKTLPHLANRLAAAGLCDLLLPASYDEDLIAAFRLRLGDAVAALRRFQPTGSVILVLDAIDHCGMEASRTQTVSFAHLLLQSLNIAPIEGVAVIASCRTHRRHLAQGEAGCREFEIPAFTPAETRRLVEARCPGAEERDFTVLQRRTGGNPRLLDNLLRQGPPFDPAVPQNDAERLEPLLEAQIEAAQKVAVERGTNVREIRGLLAGLALLPPPVPVDELAAALDLDPSVVTSFVTDLFPLIEATPTGLIFRDEPTETVVRERIGDDTAASRDLVERLQRRQLRSVYAARALPGILVELDDAESLILLAFEDFTDPRFSRVARRAIRLARLSAAATVCARAGRIDDLARIALEAARISSATERSDLYLRQHPDLVAISGDEEAIRRFRDDRGGWSGSRHAALAVLDAFAGDLTGAALEADRALTWHDWLRREQRDGRHRMQRGITQCVVDGLFIKLLMGRGPTIARWLGQFADFHAFRLSAGILRLLERLGHVQGREVAAAVIRRLAHCRAAVPPVLVAIATIPDLPDADRLRILKRLADTPAEPDPERGFSDRRNIDAYAEACLLAAGQAVPLGIAKLSGAIEAHAGPHQCRVYQFTDPWPLGDTVGRHLIHATLAATRRRRPTHAVDLLPDEMRAAIPAAVWKRGPAAAARRLGKIISAAKASRHDQPKAPISRDDAYGWERIIQHRLALLAPIVETAAGILTQADRDGAIRQALATATQTIARCEDYPFREQRPFISHAALRLLRWAIHCRRGFNPESGKALATFMEGIQSPLVAEWIATITLLTQSEATHASALRLTKGLEPILQKETNLSEQIRNLGALARALMPLSIDEARVQFRKGLEIADSAGSDDQELIGDFVMFAARYQGDALPDRDVHNFVRLCELNFPDEPEGFEWRRFGEALAGIAGPKALAPIARVADRGKAALGWTLPPLLKALVERERLSPIMAAGLGGMAEFKSTWNWLEPTFVAAVLKRLPTGHREAFAWQTLVELDRSENSHIRTDTLDGLKSLFTAELPSNSAALLRVRALAGSPQSSDDSTIARTRRRAPKALHSRLTEQEFEAAVEAALAAIKPNRPTAGFVLQSFAETVSDPGTRARLLELAISSSTLSFEDKTYFLEAAQETWRGQSAGLDAQLADSAFQLALRHMSDVVRSGTSWRRPIRRLAGYAGERRQELVTSVIAALAGQDLEISSIFWMSAAVELARFASPQAIGGAIARYSAQSTDALPSHVGDGDPASVAASPETDDAIVGDLLWARMGSPTAADRWRAVHALRRLVGYGVTGLLKHLLGTIDRTEGGAFQDRTLPFMHLHARLWLMVAVARIAQEAPAALTGHRLDIEKIAFDDEMPHVLLRHFAIAALRSLPAGDNGSDGQAYNAALDALNRPKGPRVLPTRNRPGFFSMRPAERPEADPPFHFDYDFDKYHVDPLGRLFGLPTWEVEDIAISWIRQWDAKVGSMWDCARPRPFDEDRSSGSFAVEEDRYGGYLAWHAVLVTAGQLAKTLPEVGETWEDDPWAKWMEERCLSFDDGAWLADGTDLFPVEDRKSILPAAKGSDRAPVPPHPLDLLSLTGVDDALQLPSWLVVSGHWDSAEGLDVTIGSQLVDDTLARAVGHAIFCAEPHFAYLPVDDNEHDDWDRRPERERELLHHWLAAEQHLYAKLDKYDPYGFHTALQRVRPSEWLRTTLDLRRADRFGRAWSGPNGRHAIRTEAWGTSTGRRRHRSERGGARLLVEAEAIEALLEREKKALLILVKLRKYLEKDDDNPFRFQMLVLIVRPGQPIEIIWSVPPRLRDASAALDRRDRSEFSDRMAAVEALGPFRQQSWPRTRPRTAPTDRS